MGWDHGWNGWRRCCLMCVRPLHLCSCLDGGIQVHPDHEFSHEVEDNASPPSDVSRKRGAPLRPQAKREPLQRALAPSAALPPSPPRRRPRRPHAQPRSFRIRRRQRVQQPLRRLPPILQCRRTLTLKSEVSGIHYNLEDEFHNSPFRRPDFWKIHPWERAVRAGVLVRPTPSPSRTSCATPSPTSSTSAVPSARSSTGPRSRSRSRTASTSSTRASAAPSCSCARSGQGCRTIPGCSWTTRRSPTTRIPPAG
ncbi:hypothetical protein OF83DRAFT_1116632, partial [Amylostereum chailletii]